MSATLQAQKYEAGTAKETRAESRVPAVIYGHGRETLNVSVDLQDFRRTYRTAKKSTLVDVQLEKDTIPVLIHIVETHPISGEPTHIDFHAVNMNEEVHASIPVDFTGTSDAVKLLGGVLTTQHDQIEVKCLPKNLISSIAVDLGKLKTFHDSITVEDIKFPEGITVLDDLEVVIASVNAPRLATAEEEAVGEVEEGEEEKTEEKKEG